MMYDHNYCYVCDSSKVKSYYGICKECGDLLDDDRILLIVYDPKKTYFRSCIQTPYTIERTGELFTVTKKWFTAHIAKDNEELFANTFTQGIGIIPDDLAISLDMYTPKHHGEDVVLIDVATPSVGGDDYHNIFY